MEASTGVDGVGDSCTVDDNAGRRTKSSFTAHVGALDGGITVDTDVVLRSLETQFPVSLSFLLRSTFFINLFNSIVET